MLALDHYNYFLKKIEEIKEESLFSKEEGIFI